MTSNQQQVRQLVISIKEHGHLLGLNENQFCYFHYTESTFCEKHQFQKSKKRNKKTCQKATEDVLLQANGGLVYVVHIMTKKLMKYIFLKVESCMLDVGQVIKNEGNKTELTQICGSRKYVTDKNGEHRKRGMFEWDRSSRFPFQLCCQLFVKL